MASLSNMGPLPRMLGTERAQTTAGAAVIPIE